MSEPCTITVELLKSLGFYSQGNSRPWVLDLAGERQLAVFLTGGVYIRNGISTFIGSARTEAALIDLVRAVQAVQEDE
jgi:hypothetical protein